MKEAYIRKGFKVTNEQAEDIWSVYSGSMHANWMMMDNGLDSLFELTKDIMVDEYFERKILKGSHGGL